MREDSPVNISFILFFPSTGNSATWRPCIHYTHASDTYRETGFLVVHCLVVSVLALNTFENKVNYIKKHASDPIIT
jgi:hypothetical protein